MFQSYKQLSFELDSLLLTEHDNSFLKCLHTVVTGKETEPLLHQRKNWYRNRKLDRSLGPLFFFFCGPSLSRGSDRHKHICVSSFCVVVSSFCRGLFVHWTPYKIEKI